MMGTHHIPIYVFSQKHLFPFAALDLDSCHYGYFLSDSFSQSEGGVRQAVELYRNGICMLAKNIRIIFEHRLYPMTFLLRSSQLADAEESARNLHIFHTSKQTSPSALIYKMKKTIPVGPEKTSV